MRPLCRSHGRLWLIPALLLFLELLAAATGGGESMKQGFYTAITSPEASSYMCALGMSVISVAEGEFALEYYFLRIFIFFYSHFPLLKAQLHCQRSNGQDL